MPGQFDEPVGVDVDPVSGEVWVADVWNKRVQKFDSDLRFLELFRISGWRGQASDAKPYLASDGIGGVFITDPENGKILRIRASGDLEEILVAPNERIERIERPSGIAFDHHRNHLLVADSSANRVVVLQGGP